MPPSNSDTIFTKIIKGQIPCHKVYENDHVLAFLDINPLVEGHTLVIPKMQVERLEDLPPEAAAEIGRRLGAIARRVLAAVGADDYNILQNNGPASGQEVPHVHFHIIPRRSGDGLGYRWHPRAVDSADLAALAVRIAAC
jgi:histidine triad (HIT) family protein